MADQTRAARPSDSPLACTTCGNPGGVFRVDFRTRSIVAICDGCCDQRATACPFCDNPFGREVKRASKCKKCGETVARNSRSSVLASRLATQSVCDALGEIEPDERSDVSGDWLRGCLLECLLAAAKAGRDPQSIDAAFAAALRGSFERGLTHERLQGFGLSFALAIWTCGGNPRPIQRALHRLRLESLRAMELVEAVTVLACGDPCEKCERLKGRVWSFEEALAKNPLPCRECLNTNEHGFGWCRCEYEPQLIPELEEIVGGIERSGDIDRARERINAEDAARRAAAEETT
jgi:hypothetical protein